MTGYGPFSPRLLDSVWYWGFPPVPPLFAGLRRHGVPSVETCPDRRCRMDDRVWRILPPVYWIGFGIRALSAGVEAATERNPKPPGASAVLAEDLGHLALKLEDFCVGNNRL